MGGGVGGRGLAQKSAALGVLNEKDEDDSEALLTELFWRAAESSVGDMRYGSMRTEPIQSAHKPHEMQRGAGIEQNSILHSQCSVLASGEARLT